MLRRHDAAELYDRGVTVKRVRDIRYRTTLAVVLATVVFLLSAIPFSYVMHYVGSVSLDLAEWFQYNGYPRVCVTATMMLGLAVTLLPSLGAGLCVFWWCSRKTPGNGYTRCAECDHILNGLGGLRCPECGKEV